MDDMINEQEAARVRQALEMLRAAEDAVRHVMAFTKSHSARNEANAAVVALGNAEENVLNLLDLANPPE